MRFLRELIRALLQASDLYAATVQRLGSLRAQPRPAGCPFDAVCQHCPASYEDDVCMPDERRAYELTLRYPHRDGDSP
jgi:hypothetical protein